MQEGACQVTGELVAVNGAVTTWDGSAALAVETGPVGWDRRWAQVEVRSGGSSCRVDLDGVLMLGERRAFQAESEQLRVRHPSVHARLASEVHKVNGVRVIADTYAIVQRVLLAGQPGFLAGEVMRMRAPKEGYREAFAQQLVLASGLGMPLIVSSRPKSEVVRYLFGPVILHALVALAAIVVAAALVATDRWIAAALAP